MRARLAAAALTALACSGCTWAQLTGVPAVQTRPAPLGAAIQLQGMGTGERMQVTATAVYQDVRRAWADHPGQGLRYALARLTLRDNGSWPYLGPVPVAVRVVAGGRLYAPVSAPGEGGRACQHFAPRLQVRPGATVTGCVVFAVPARVPVTLVMFGMDGLVHTPGAVADHSEGVWRA